MRALAVILLSGSLVAGCSHHKRGHRQDASQAQPGTLAAGLWTLHTEPASAHDDAYTEISGVVAAFHASWVPQTKSVQFEGTPGFRLCGSVNTLGCNPTPTTIEFATSAPGYSLRFLVIWVVAHDLFHVYAEELGNHAPGRDPYHTDPRWAEWNAWRDSLP